MCLNSGEVAISVDNVSRLFDEEEVGIERTERTRQLQRGAPDVPL